MRGQETKTETATKRNSISEVSKMVYKNRLVRALKNKGLSGRGGVPILTEKFPTLGFKNTTPHSGITPWGKINTPRTRYVLYRGIFIYIEIVVLCSVTTGTPKL